jgi:GH35 family endo-1,4-beta-xylanase
MQLGACLPKLNRLNPKVLKLATQFDVVSPLDWLCPSVLVYEGITTQYDVIKALGNTRLRGHCLIAAKEEYLPTIWGGRCRGKNWAGQRVNLSKSQQKAVIINHTKNTIRKFPSVQKWDLIAGNVKPNSQFRFEFVEELLDAAIIANPNKKYYLDELLCTSYSRWENIIKLASNENIGGVGIQIHANNKTDFKATFKLLKRVLKLANSSNVNVDLSEVGYWDTDEEPAKDLRVAEFINTIVNLSLDYNVKDFIWWGLIPYAQKNLLSSPRIVPLFDLNLNPTIVLENLCHLLP